MIPGDPLYAAAGGAVALISLLIARKTRPRKTGNDPRRNLVIVVNEKALKAMQS